LEVLKRQFQYFGPIPAKLQEVADVTLALLYLMHVVSPEKMTQFHRITEREVCKMDKEFIGKIMKMDYRDRPTAAQLLEDEWFKEEADEHEGGEAEDKLREG
jgi:hypothetical protein